MIMDKGFLDWYGNANADEQVSALNFVILTCSSLKFINRLKVAIEIILGEKYCKWVSRNQVPKTIEETSETVH